MSTVVRYSKLLAVQVRSSLLLALQYRLEFFGGGLMSLFWTAAALVPLFVLFQGRPSVAGWSRPEALLVVAFFVMLKGVLDGFIRPGLQAVVEHVRKGTLDFILLKPADAQFLVSTARVDLFQAWGIAGGAGLGVYAFRALGRPLSLVDLAAALVLLGGATALLYAMWVMVASLAFVFVKVDNLTYLFASVYDAARWPSSVFRGAFAFVFTFVIPLSLMTTFPALALLGRLPLRAFLGALGGAVVALVVARQVWRLALARYTGAGG